ncbi:MAG: hypothetical protein ABI039_00230 [Vicinamibacterales bacterium]
MKGMVRPLIAGLALAAAFTASPLTVIALPVAFVVIRLAGRELPEDERRSLAAMLWIALGARLVAIAALFLIGLPGHSDAAVGGLSGDDAYYFGRAIRARDLILGFASGKYDFFVVNDAYGQTSYLRLLTWLQVVAGPTPYGMRVVNAVMFVTGGAVLFRTVRRGFGAMPAFAGLAVLLFLPSLFFWSISLLKESMFFMLTALLIAATMRVLTDWRSKNLLPMLAVIVACLWLLDDLRRGGLILATAGIALGLTMRVVFARPARVTIAAVAAATLLLVAVSSGPVRARFVAGVTQAAQVHAGHVFTVGHAYKLLDDGFYMYPRDPQHLTGAQSLRFLARAARSLLLTPLPWEMRSRGELAFLPEHLIWFAMLIFAPIGIVGGWKRSPLLVCVLAGYAIPTALTLAVTNGNVGTLLRLRALVTPQLVWISALGLLAVLAMLLERSQIGHNTSAAVEVPTA